MGEEEIGVFFLSLALTVIIMVMAICFIIISIRRRTRAFEREREHAVLRHQQELLEARQEIQRSLMQSLGSELHATVGQKLTLAYLQMENALQLDDVQTLKHHIVLHNNLVQESLQELRSLSKILISHTLADFSLIHFLDKELNRLQQSHLCNATLHYPEGIFRIADDRTELHLARICQEFIQNSLKHSGCTLISIDITEDNDIFEIRCRDNGAGFDPAKAKPYDSRSGSGVAMINSRAKSIGAHCIWTTDDGTTLLLTINPNQNTHTYET
ncbi:sensor histidine kinase [Chitinophaga filiformis]|uniref:histidine kinase n=1 Tax=Chitinophaga filiformis TaxID=104663 RepID=A0A1G7LRK4_CHIFI|nr:ATP-binding protein [Chitinophaga filiformis]SDF52125.1 Histidine kinase-, DNA gyrase B-, and HSP90-like ATPase [Chitinophaga filiformis]